MTFIWPFMLPSLLLLPLCLWPYLRAQRRRRAMSANLGTLGLAQNRRGAEVGWRRHLPFAFFMMGLGLLCLALARPQMALRLPRIEGTVILALDVSRSMAARDMGTEDTEPTRMEAAKAAAEAIIAQKPNTVAIGVVSFSEGGLVVQQPTHDQLALLDTIARLTPQSGTSLGQGMLASLNTILEQDLPPPEDDGEGGEPVPVPTPLPSGSFSDAIIVLLTDGENTDAPEPLDVAETTADYGVRVYTVGMGSVAGTTVEIDGFTVFTQLNEETLRQIADVTNGLYYSGENEDELLAIYDDLRAGLVIRPEETEVTSLFAGVSTLILLMGGLFSLLWFGRLP